MHKIQKMYYNENGDLLPWLYSEKSLNGSKMGFIFWMFCIIGYIFLFLGGKGESVLLFVFKLDEPTFL